jgi:proteasome beta subunit
LKKLWREGFTADEGALCAVQSLYDAADEDSATGGPDLARRIYPVVSLVTRDGYRRLSDDEVGAIVDTVIAARMDSPGGPPAPLV